jgi:hypothetical protein
MRTKTTTTAMVRITTTFNSTSAMVKTRDKSHGKRMTAMMRTISKHNHYHYMI